MDIEKSIFQDPEYLKKLQSSMPDLNHITLDFSATQRLAEEVSASMEEHQREIQAREDAKYQALCETANNTREIRERQDRIIDNQLKQIERQEQEIQILKEIFTSGEDGVAVQKEIMQLMIEQEENKHPISDLLKDKGADLEVAAITAVAPLAMETVKQWLRKKGVFIP